MKNDKRLFQRGSERNKKSYENLKVRIIACEIHDIVRTSGENALLESGESWGTGKNWN